MTGRTLRWVWVTGVLVASAGCLVKDSTQTWYLEPDGSVTWVVLEKDVRSDADTAADREQEERTYIEAALKHEHSTVETLTTLGAADVSSRVLRDRVPFIVVTEGRFASLERLGQRLIEENGASGHSRLTRIGEDTEWAFELTDTEKAGTETPGPAFETFENLKVVLATGRFVAARHFTLSTDGRVATIVLDEPAKEGASTPFALTLRWTER